MQKNFENRNLNKCKKAIFGALIGTLLMVPLVMLLYSLSGQSLYFALLGLGTGMGFSIGSTND
jgi:hypothetical protein